MRRTPPDPLDQVSTAALSPVVLLLGPGDWHREQALTRIRERVLGTEPDCLAEFRGRAGEADLVALLDAARTRPMVSDRKMVVILGIEALSATDLELLADYAVRPLTSSCLVLTAAALPASAGARSLRAAAVVVNCPALRTWDVPAWLEARLRERGLRCEADVPKAIQRALGDDAGLLHAGIDTLVQFHGARPDPLRREDVEAALEPVPHGTVWEFVEALEERNASRALALLEALLEGGEPPESMIRLIARSRRQLLAGVEAREAGGSEDGVLAAMGVHPRARNSPRLRQAILARLRCHHREGLLVAWRRLLHADSSLKGGGGAGAQAVFSLLVLALAAPEGGTSRRPADS